MITLRGANKNNGFNKYEMSNQNIPKVVEGSKGIQSPMPTFAKTMGIKLEGSHKNMPSCIYFSDDTLKLGTMFLGSAGCGKTNIINYLMSQTLHSMGKHDFAFILDIKGDYKNMFYDTGDILLGPNEHDNVWNMFDDIMTSQNPDMAIRTLCYYLYRGRESSQNPFFVNSARDITSCVIQYFIREAMINNNHQELNNHMLSHFLKSATIADYAVILNSYEDFKGALTYIDAGDSTALSVVSEIRSMANDVFVASYCSDGKSFSLNNAIRNRDYNNEHGQVVFLRMDVTNSISTGVVESFLIDSMLSEIMGLPENMPGKVYIFLDEFISLPRLQNLTRALTLCRSKNICVIAAIQHLSQRVGNKKDESITDIVDSFQNLICMKTDSISSFEYIEKRFGNCIVERRYTASDGSSQYQLMKEPCVQSTDLLTLNPGDAFVKVFNKDVFKFHFFEYTPN